MDAVLISKMEIRKVALSLSKRDKTPAQTHTLIHAQLVKKLRWDRHGGRSTNENVTLYL